MLHVLPATLIATVLQVMVAKRISNLQLPAVDLAVRHAALPMLKHTLVLLQSVESLLAPMDTTTVTLYFLTAVRLSCLVVPLHPIAL